MSSSTPHPPNRLARESSPYLLQHATNPVDWYSWGEEAFDAALKEDKPVLLSIGYSACHWCHVMERESFENPAIAELMNRLFVNIKVDREERPDVDSIYMNFVQMTTGSGGWPLTVFMSPDKVPFYGGTYFPPQDHYGRPGFPRLLEAMSDVYRNRRSELEAGREETIRRLAASAEWDGPPSAKLDPQALTKAASSLLRALDPVHGGFGTAPKFPSSMALGFLLRHHHRTSEAAALQAVQLSLDSMAQGGLYDQLGGGFHRYSVDERWLVPHFEKMLYDNALLVRLYLEAFQLTGQDSYRRIAEETLDWTLREMTHPAGGLYSALDADSEGQEGRFYVWTPQETREILGEDEAKLFDDFFDVSQAGNFEGDNILHHRSSMQSIARRFNLDPDQAARRIDESRRRLVEFRESRVRPGLDDKVLASWNGMMLTAFAEASFVLDRDDYREAARRNARFLIEEMQSDGRLLRTWKSGQAKLNGYLEDYALVSEGLLALYQATGEVEWLREASRLTELQIELFYDPLQGDFYFTSHDHEKLLVRQKEFLDNAVPSGNSVACFNLLKLAHLLDREEWAEIAKTLLGRVADAAERHPLGFGYWLQGLDFAAGPVSEIVLTGPATTRRPLESVLRNRFVPNKVVAMTEGVDQESADLIPLLEGKDQDDQATAYVCRRMTCQEPAHTAQAFSAQLDSVQP